MSSLKKLYLDSKAPRGAKRLEIIKNKAESLELLRISEQCVKEVFEIEAKAQNNGKLMEININDNLNDVKKILQKYCKNISYITFNKPTNSAEIYMTSS